VVGAKRLLIQLGGGSNGKGATGSEKNQWTSRRFKMEQRKIKLGRGSHYVRTPTFLMREKGIDEGSSLSRRRIKRGERGK